MLISPKPAVVRTEFIDGSNRTASCHASTIVQLKTGELLAAWFGGSAESAPDVAIYLTRRSSNGWSAAERVADGVVADGHRYSCYNPVLFQPKNGPLLLFYKVGNGPQTWVGMMKRSPDSGKTWSTAESLPKGIYGPIKNKPLELRDGTLLCGSSEEVGGWTVHFERTTDFGATWSRTPPLNDAKLIGAIQPSVMALGGQALCSVGRTQQGKLFYLASNDLGATWGRMRLIDVQNPNSGTDAITLRDGRLLLVFNDSSSARSPLAVAVSADGEHWHKALDLETGAGEFSYPAVIQSDDGLIHVSYTWKRKRIRHVAIDPERVR